MKEELKEYLGKADSEDLARCLRENFCTYDQENHYRMISELYFNDKKSFGILSPGCKAAAIIYIFLGAR